MSPFEILCTTRRPSRADKTRLVEASRRIESRALTLGGGATLWAGLQHSSYLTERTAWVYRTIAYLGSTVHLHAPRLLEFEDAPPTLHLHAGGAPGEWVVLLLGERAGWGMVARDRSLPGEREDRRTFDWVTTRDRQCVLEAAEELAAWELLSSAHGSSTV